LIADVVGVLQRQVTHPIAPDSGNCKRLQLRIPATAKQRRRLRIVGADNQRFAAGTTPHLRSLERHRFVGF